MAITLPQSVLQLLPTDVTQLLGLGQPAQTQEWEAFKAAWADLALVLSDNWQGERFRRYWAVPEHRSEALEEAYEICVATVESIRLGIVENSVYRRLATAESAPPTWSPSQMTPEKQAFLRVLEAEEPDVAAQWIEIEQSIADVASKTEDVQQAYAHILAVYAQLDEAVDAANTSFDLNWR